MPHVVLFIVVVVVVVFPFTEGHGEQQRTKSRGDRGYIYTVRTPMHFLFFPWQKTRKRANTARETQKQNQVFVVDVFFQVFLHDGRSHAMRVAVEELSADSIH